MTTRAVTTRAVSTRAVSTRAVSTGLVPRIYDALRSRITAQQLQPGDRLRVIPLARDFDVSPTPVREALARLHADGLLVLRPNRGYQVSPGPDASSRMHWMDARVILEVNTLRLAAAAMTDGVLRELTRLNGRMRSGRFGGDVESGRAFAQLNAGFHGTLVEAAGNPFLLRAWQEVASTAQFSRIHFRHGVRHQALIVAEHQQVIDALAAGDTEAAVSALRRHIVDSLDRDDSATAGARQPAYQ